MRDAGIPFAKGHHEAKAPKGRAQEDAMRRIIIVQALATAVAATSLTGCPIWWDDWGHDGGSCQVGDPACDQECNVDDDCLDAYWCDAGYCEPSGWCTFGCAPGTVCDEERDTCVPLEGCTRDEDCTRYPGYCDETQGICVMTDECLVDGDCAVFGESFVCSAGECGPDEGPCPDGHCGCLSDVECDGGWICEGGVCNDPAELCIFDFSCLAGMRCQNSFCVVDCSGGSACPTGQVCDGALCVEDPDGGGQCLYSSDCGASQRCVNGYCTNECSADAECGAFARCLSGLCRPDGRPAASCEEVGGCGALDCVAGACRMPCVDYRNCETMGAFTVCDDASGSPTRGYCVTPSEAAGECARASECVDGVCLDGAC